MLNIKPTKTPQEWDEAEPGWDQVEHEADLEAAKKREADRRGLSQA